MNNRSRLYRREESNSKKTIILSLLGIIVLGVLIVKVGIPFIANLSLAVNNGKEDIPTQKKDVFIAPPVLNTQPTATNSAMITISGIGASKKEINLYINGNLTDKTESKKDGTFRFEDVSLSKGENEIQTKIIDGTNSSDYSNTVTVTYKNSAPSLNINSPHDGDSFSKDSNTTSVTGQTDPGVKVTVNDLWAIVDEKGNFSYTLPLKNGDNPVKIVGTDEAGNRTEKSLTVKYSE